jgi:hypothetical protein
MARIHLLVIALALAASPAYTRDTKPATVSALKLPSDAGTGPKAWTHLNLRNNPRDFQFAIVGDRTGGERKGVFDLAVKKLNLLQPEFVMCVGDLIDGYTTNTGKIAGQWKEFDASVAKLEMPFFHVAGNHDISNAVQAAEWKKRRGQPFYHFVYHDVLFLCLNSEDPHAKLGGDQIAYFARVLKENPDTRWVLAFLHQPLWVENEIVGDPKYYKQSNWKEFESLLAGRRYTIFAGHFHQYTHAIRNGMQYYILATSGGASRLRGAKPHGEIDHVVWVTMRDAGPRIANLMLDGIHDENIRSESMAILVSSFLKRGISGETLFVQPGESHSAATRLRVTNNTNSPLNMHIDFASIPGGTLRAEPPLFDISLPPRSEDYASVRVVAEQPLDRTNLGAALPYNWQATLRDPESGEDAVIRDSGNLGIETTFPVTRRTAPVAVDGDLSDWDDLPFHCDGANRDFANWQGREDASYRFSVQYDDRNLYVAVDATDTSAVLNPTKHPWEQDGIEVRVDARRDPGRSRGQGENENVDFLGIVASPGDGPDPLVLYQREKLPAGTQVSCRKTATGHATEIAIPGVWLDAKQGAPWSALRINVTQNDVDSTTETVARQLRWRPDWRTPQSFEGSGTFERIE